MQEELLTIPLDRLRDYRDVVFTKILTIVSEYRQASSFRYVRTDYRRVKEIYDSALKELIEVENAITEQCNRDRKSVV